MTRTQEFYKRWNLELNYQEEFEKFRNRILVAIDEIVGVFILENPSVSKQFHFALGSSVVPSSATKTLENLVSKYSLLVKRNFKDNDIYLQLLTEQNNINFFFALQCLFWALEECKCPVIHNLGKAIQAIAQYTPTIGLGVAVKDQSVIFYPAGAKLLDDKLVNDNLLWLEQYPKAAKHFEEALKFFQMKDIKKYRNLLDNLRTSLEEVLRAILNNDKSLENQNKLLGQWLEEKKVHVHIRNMYFAHLKQFTLYQNDAVKHGDESSPIEIEFMIYLTGTLIRFLLELKRGNSA